ncbi:MAG TPA: site-specific integrase [Candidatus Entotheonella sp.]|jgi:integrase
MATTLDLERYRRKRKQAGKSDVSINRELGFLRHVFNMAIDWDKAVENPVKKIRFAREDNGRVRFLSADEETRLLAHCSDPLRPIIITALHTGLRRSELLALTWDDVDFERGLITVRAAYAKNGERRSVPMNTMLTRTLEAVRIKARGTVFRKKDGEPYRDFRTAFERAVTQADIPDFTFHDLRHTFASRLVMKGVDLPTVKELMGHKHINMTLRYTHLASDHKQRAVALLDQVPSIFTTVGVSD